MPREGMIVIDASQSFATAVEPGRLNLPLPV